MKETIIFAGTTEGRLLSEGIAAAGVRHIVCVATEYGELVMGTDPLVQVRSGRMDEVEMEAFLKENAADVVYDATHPFAQEVTRNIKTACEACGAKYIRILREDAEESSRMTKTGAAPDICYFENSAACAEALKQTEGNILLTTGSKEVAVYAADAGVKERLYARVLPSEESIRLCNDAGLFGKQVIAMHGPFSTALNEALIHQFAIRCMVTKQSGTAGGYYEKVQAASQTGVQLFVIGKQEEEAGVTVQEALANYNAVLPLQMTLIGCGPGGEQWLTQAGKQAIKSAEVVFGSKRLVGQIENKETYPYYLAKDVIGVLEENRHRKAVVLFSGDSGFFSGAQKMRTELSEWAKKKGFAMQIETVPGISSLSYLAAKAGEAYQEYPFLSMHGRTSENGVLGNVLSAIRTNSKVFLILSGASDVVLLGKTLLQMGLDHCEVILGYELSYKNEKLLHLSVEDCLKVTEEGLYAAIIKNPATERKRLLPVKKDTDFLRNANPAENAKKPDAPMTKEMIRHASLIRLELSQGDVLYDVGSGTGSVCIEAACLDPSLKVYAIEKKPAAAELTRKNAARFGCPNLQVVEGLAPQAFEGLEPATHVFIGGSGGNLKDILSAIKRPDQPVRVVINAISLETIAEVSEILKNLQLSDLQIEQIAVSNAKKAGSYHLMTAENPVMIFSFTL